MGRRKIDEMLLSAFGWLPARVALGMLTFFGFVNQFMVRVNLSVAIVAMVYQNKTVEEVQAQCIKGSEGTSANNSLLVGTTEYQSNALTAMKDRELTQDAPVDESLAWDEVTQGVVLASYYYGYTITQILGGRLAELYGTRLVFGGCILGSGIITLFTPIAARAHVGAAIALRVLLGLTGGVAWPSMHALLSRWIPPLERPRFIAFAYLATTLSVTFTLPLCGVIIDWHGWEAVFYTTGVLCLIWCMLWFALMHDSPGKHPRISREERELIEMSVAAGGSSKRTGSGIPWRHISTSMPVWAIIVCDMGNTFGLSIYLTQLPTYMRNVLGFSIKKNGLLSGLPFLCRYVGGIISSTVGDWLLSRGCLSIVNTRRIFSAVAMLGPTIVLVGVAYSGCDPALTVSLLCLSMFLNGAITTSQLVNHTDIAPNFSGTLFGISNTFASIASFISPVAVAAIIENQQTMTQWHKVFWMCVPIYAASAIFYLAFCSGTVQPWNYAGQHRRHAQEEAERDGPEATALQ
ncbi:sialin-like [Penaeus indicus]|uniref:sialin-like n=1 Tax=Penaeus indicus TaxID=29960 RepID=UPI00300D89BA